ncbi:replication protein (plasmid) [Klebsiella pneumoniae]|nr:replication protein [Klebsiella pneumoniae]
MISLSPPTICNSAVYTRVFALDMAATLAVPFTGDGRDAAEILRSLPPAG